MCTPSQPLIIAEDRPLSRPFLVRGSLWNNPWVAVPFILALFAVVNWVATRPVPPGEPSVSLLLAGLFTAFALVTGFITFRKRIWLEVTVNGFILRDRRGRRHVPREHVLGLKENWKTRRTGFLRRRIGLEYQHDGATHRALFDYEVPPAHPDPLATTWENIAQHIAEAARRELPRGSRLCGDGWQLVEGVLYYRHGRRSVKLSELTWLGHFDGCLCLWKGDEETPFLRIRSDTWNAGPLGRLLGEVVHRRPLPEAGGGLGRLLFRRRSPEWIVGLCLLLPFLALFLGLLVLGVRAEQRGADHGPGAFLVAFISLPFALLGAVCLRRGLRNNLRCHELGVAQRRGRALLQLRDDDIVTLSGSPLEAPVLIELWPQGDLDRPTFVFRTASRPDPDLKGLFDRITGRLADVWQRRLAAGEPFIWTLRLCFLPGGLEYRPDNHNEPMVVPYERTRFGTFDGQFLLYVEGGPQPVLKEAMTQPGFAVGLELLRRLYTSRSIHPTTPPPGSPAQTGITRREPAPQELTTDYTDKTDNKNR